MEKKKELSANSHFSQFHLLLLLVSDPLHLPGLLSPSSSASSSSLASPAHLISPARTAPCTEPTSSCTYESRENVKKKEVQQRPRFSSRRLFLQTNNDAVQAYQDVFRCVFCFFSLFLGRCKLTDLADGAVKRAIGKVTAGELERVFCCCRRWRCWIALVGRRSSSSSSSHPPIPSFLFFIPLFPVGNIPYGMTEEMLADLFAEVGPVKTSR